MAKEEKTNQSIETYREGFKNGYLYGRKQLAKDIEAFISQKGFRESSSDLEEVRKWITFLINE